MSYQYKKYNAMEKVLQKINTTCILLPKHEEKRHTRMLNEVLTLIISKMKECDKLFYEMYQEIFYGGSYYEGLKITRADEYDVDLTLIIPEAIVAELFGSNIPGFVHVKFVDYIPHLRDHSHPYKRSTNRRNANQGGHVPKFRGFQCFLNEHHYLDTAKVLQWMEKVVTRALNSFKKSESNASVLYTSYGNVNVTKKKSGPAITLHVARRGVSFDVDLVPCFVFEEKDWPKGYRRNPVPDIKPYFFAVPKSPKGLSNSNHYWRLSFQEQERYIMHGMEKLKPAIKLLKRMRDVLDHKCIASYYIKTLALWMMKREKAYSNFGRFSLSYIFMKLLKEYQRCLSVGEIPYYWNDKYNFLQNEDAETLRNFSNKILHIIKAIERNLPENPFVIVQYLVTEEEEIDFSD